MIKNTCPDKSGNRENLKNKRSSFKSFSTNVPIATNVPIVDEDLLRAFYRVAGICWFMWSVKKHCVAKVLPVIWGKYLHENNHNYNSYRFSYKFAFILFSSFLTDQKQESGFQQVGGLVTKNIYVFVYILYFKAMPSSIDFYKGIFLYVTPVHTHNIGPW